MFVRANALFLFLNSGVVLVFAACSGDRLSVQPPSPTPIGVASPILPTPAPVVVPTPLPDPYPQAIDRASSAFTIGQSAQSSDDWRLVASRWQQAIELLAAVPPANANHSQAQTKLAEYRRNLAYAQQQADRPTPDAASRVVVVPLPAAVAIAPTSSPSVVLEQTTTPTGFNAPIVRRVGGTPVINVTFNGGQTYEMILDTGASGTLITQQMASTLGVVPVAQASVDTASARSVLFPLGYVRSMQVNQIVAQDVLVAIAGADLDIGLLGQDFFGNFDISIRQSEVEFRQR